MTWVVCSDRFDWGAIDTAVETHTEWCRNPVLPDDCSDLEGLAGCAEDLDLDLVAHRLRIAGIDPFGTPIVALDRVDRQSPRRVRTRLDAASSRAVHYRGVAAGNVKTILPRVRSRRSFLTIGGPAYRVVPDADPARCRATDGCTICVDACPHGALEWTSGVIRKDRLACEACGRCVAACPADAMVHPTFTPDQLHAEMLALARCCTEPFGVALNCSRGEPTAPAEGWFTLQVPCVGMVPPHWMIALLLYGAAAVVVPGCSCGVEADAEERIEATVGLARRWLASAGVDRGRERLARRTAPFPPGPLPPVEPPRPLFGACGAADVATMLGGIGVDDGAAPLGLVTISERCTGCGMCATACPTGALVSHTVDGGLSLMFDPARCPGCGRCVARCPEDGSISVRRTVQPVELGAGTRAVATHRLALCVGCGNAIATQTALDRIAVPLAGDVSVLKRVTSLCIECRRTTMVF